MANTNLPRVPEGLRDLMKAYTKDVLREKPTNLYEFSANYFERISGTRVHHKVLKYEPPQSYELIMKNRIRQQVPISLVFSIIPDNLTELIKKFIKAVLREKPENLLLYAVEYFQKLRNTHSPRLEYTKYSDYEKYVEEKGNSAASVEKCVCGRLLSSKGRTLATALEEEPPQPLEPPKPTEPTESHTESSATTHSLQYLKAVCIIQKHMRKYLKAKREKNIKASQEKQEPREHYKSADYMNAVFVIQRQFRRYLAKKRAKAAIELKKRNQYDSVEYMNAIRIIQRYCRNYLRKSSSKRPLNNSYKTHSTDRTDRKFSLTTAAFIIQRAFRNMVKTRRAKRHINAELDQGDEVNDNASEAASYTSASTALLSTESVCEHYELGGNVYEEGVHQQTIREDEEVENDHTNNLQNEYKTKAIKYKGKSIDSNGNDLAGDTLKQQMNNSKKRVLYGQRNRRDIQSVPSFEKDMVSVGTSEDELLKTNLSTVKNNASNEENEKTFIAEESSVYHAESLEHPSNSQKQSLESKISDNIMDANELKNLEDSISTLDSQVENKHSEKSIKKSISQADNLEETSQSDKPDGLSNEESPKAKPLKNSEELIKKSISQTEDLDTQSGELEENMNKSKNSEELIKKRISQAEDLNTKSAELESLPKEEEDMNNFKQLKNSEEFIKKSLSQAEELNTKSAELENLPKEEEDMNKAKPLNNSEELNKKSPSQAEDLNTKSAELESLSKEEEDMNKAKQLKNSDELIKKSISQAEDLITVAQSDESKSLTNEEDKSKAEQLKNTEEFVKKSVSLTKDLEPAAQIDETDSLETKTTNKPNKPKDLEDETIKKNKTEAEVAETATKIQKENISTKNVADADLKTLHDEEIVAKIIPDLSSETANTNKDSTDNEVSLLEVNKDVEETKEEQSTIALSVETEVEAKPMQSKENSLETQDAEPIKVTNLNEIDKPNTEKDYSIEVNSLQSVLNKYNHDEALLEQKKTSTTTVENLDLQKASLKPDTSEESKDTETTVDNDISKHLVNIINKKSAESLEDREENLTTAEENAALKTVLLPKTESVDAQEENEVVQKLKAQTYNDKAETYSTDIGKSIIIHSVLPGEEDYELTLSSEAPLSDTNKSVADITANRKDLVKTNSEESKEALENTKNLQSVEKYKVETSENKADITKMPDTSIMKLEAGESAEKDGSEGSEKAKEDTTLSTEDTELKDTEITAAIKTTEQTTSDSLDGFKVSLESNKSKSNEETELEDTQLPKSAKPAEEEKESNKSTESKKSSGNSAESESENIKDTKTENTNLDLPTEAADTENDQIETLETNIDKNQIETSVAKKQIENTETTAADSSDNVKNPILAASSTDTKDNKSQSLETISNSLNKNKSVEDIEILSKTATETKDSENADEEKTEKHKNKINIESDSESNSEITKDTNVSQAQPEDVKNNKTTVNMNKKTSSTDVEENSKNSASFEQIEDNTLTKLTPETEEKFLESIESEAKEKEKNPELSIKAEEKLLKTLSSEKAKDIDSTSTEETEKIALITTKDTKTEDTSQAIKAMEIMENTVDEATTILSVENEPQISNVLKTTLTEESQEEIVNNKEQNMTEEGDEKLLTALIDDQVQETEDSTKVAIEETLEEKKHNNKANSSKDSEEKYKENLIAGSNKTKSVQKADTIPQISIEEAQPTVEVESENSKESKDSVDESLKPTPQTTNIEAENKNKVEVRTDSQLAESKSSLLLSNQLIDTQIKKMPSVKDKQSTSFTSGRLTNAPVAELQLKSFKTDADAGNWYDVYSESGDELIIKAKETQKTESVEIPERRPNYVYGEESVVQETVKPKQSIAFFISFDGDDGKTSFKIPKRFLREAETTAKKSKKAQKKKTEEVVSMEPITITADEDIIISDTNMGYQQFGTQKLQTIQELNENESSNELKNLLDKSVEEEISTAKKETENAEINMSTANALDDNNKDHDFKLKRSAQIIQRAYKTYKTRRADQQNAINDKAEKRLLNENLAARRIQRAVREFLLKAAQRTKETANPSKDNKYNNIEILAAIRIQKMFRNYMRRKQMANSEDISKATSATSLVTVIPNINESEATEVTLNDEDLPDELATTNSELNTTKPEWFVGTQRISLDKSDSVVVAAPEIIDTIGTTELTDNTQLESGTKLTTDIGNISNALNASKVDNGASNNSAGAASETLEDLVTAAFGELDVSFKDTTSNLLNEFLIKEIEYSSIQEPYPNCEAVQEEVCIKKSVSDSKLSEEETKDLEQLDEMDEATSKLMKPDEIIEKMSQRRSSETREKLKEDLQLAEPVFGEPIIRSMSLLQEQSSLDIEDGDIIVYNRLQRDETRESSAQSESVVFGMNDEDEKLLSNDAETARSQLSRHYTIAGDDPRVIFRSVTIDDTVRYIEHEIEDDDDNQMNNMSFCLDDEISENIRKKMMAYSLSEGDSDYYDPNKTTQDDFLIDTAMNDTMDTSTETESTIVSAATKIQAGARGFLARRRLRRASATKSSTLDTKASFGNDAISESLERFIEEEAARKIQGAYRLHSKKQKKQTKALKSGSLESSLAVKRQMLQRGDALRNDSNSTPDDESSSSTSVGQLPKDMEKKSSKAAEKSSSGSSVGQLSKDEKTQSSKDNEEESSSSSSVGQLPKDEQKKSSKDNAEKSSSSSSVGQLSKEGNTKSNKDNEAESSSGTSVEQLSKDMETKSSLDNEDENSSGTSVGQLSKDMDTKSSADNAEDHNNSVGQLSKDEKSKSSKDNDGNSSSTSVGQQAKDVEKNSNEDNSGSNSVGQQSKEEETKSSKYNAEDERSSSTSVGQLSKDVETKSSLDNADDECSSVGQLPQDLKTKSSKDNEEENSSSTSVAQLPKDMEAKPSRSTATRAKRSTDLKWPALRQNSMPVQIDCEVLRPIPKHMRRRIKSAENGKKKNRK